jgi:DNA-binding transcriptional LysR family regulator
MDLRQLEMLLAVVECGGYKRAGEKLNISHSAVHRQIRLLEEELRVRIMVRTGKNVQITETGTLLLDVARRVQHEIATLQHRIHEADQLQTGHLWIGTSTNILTFFLPPILERFRLEFPGVDVRVITGTGDHIIHELTNGRLDVAVAYAPADMPPGEPVPNCELLYKDEIVLAVADDHPLAKQRSVTLSDAVRFPFILYPKPSHARRLFDRLFENSGLTPKVSMELENEEAMEKMIAINMGIAFLSKKRAVSDKIRYLYLREQRFYFDVGLVFPRADYFSPPTREFARMCREASGVSRAAARG